MRSLVALLLAAVLASPARAAQFSEIPAIPAASFQLPASGLLTANLALRAQLVAQIQSLPTLQAGAVLPQSAALPDTTPLLRGFLAQPELIESHRAELSQVLGPESVATLSAAARSESVQSLLAAGPVVSPTDAAGVSRIAGQLNRVFDGATGSGAVDLTNAPAVDAQKALPAEWRLHPNQQIHKSEPGLEQETMGSLPKALEIMGLISYQVKHVDEKVDAPLIAWGGLPSIWKLAIIREGGRQDPGNVLYVLDSSWVIQVPTGDGKNINYITKGLYFEKDGKTPVLVTYKHPRRANYFGNLLTLGAFETASGVPLEKNLDTPMSSSSKLEKVTNDKLWTRLLLGAEGARVPVTRAFLLQDHPFLKRGEIPSSDRVKAARIPASRAEIRAAVVELLERYTGPEVVVKPSGPRFHSGEGVKFFARDQVDAIADYVQALSRHDHMSSDGVVLLEQRLSPPPVYFRLTEYKEGQPFVYQDKKKHGVQILTPAEIAMGVQPHERKDSNERVWVVRDENDQAHTVPDGFFRAGTWGKPTSGQPKDPRDAASVVPWEIMRDAWFKQHGILATDAEIAELRRERREIGEKALRAIIANERALAREEGDPYQAQTDMIGLDIMYQLEDGRLVPYVIEVNDHDAAGQHAADLFYPDRPGAHSRVWIQGMRARARRDAQRNP